MTAARKLRTDAPAGECGMRTAIWPVWQALVKTTIEDMAPQTGTQLWSRAHGWVRRR